MTDPLTIISAVSAARNVLSIAGSSWSKLKKARPAYGVFWGSFEAKLKAQEADVPWTEIKNRYWLNPDFIGRVTVLMERGDGQAEAELRRMFLNDLNPPTGSRFSQDELADHVLQVAVGCAYAVDDSPGRIAQQVVGQVGSRLDRAHADLADRLDGNARAVDVRVLLSEVAEVRADVSRLRSDVSIKGRATPQARTGVDEHRAIGSLAEQPAEGKSPAELLEDLHREDAGAAQRLSLLIGNRGASAVAELIQDRPDRDTEDTLPYLVTLGRIAAYVGAFSEAETAYLWASEAAGEDNRSRARQLVRAAAMAKIHGGSEAFQEHLAKARAVDPSHPAVAIADARDADDSAWALERIADVEPENSHERALLHVTRAQAHLAMGDEKPALDELALAKAADQTTLAVRELDGIIPLVRAQRGLEDGDRPNTEELRKAASELNDLRDGLDRQGRWTESALLAARSSEALTLADRHEDAADMLASVTSLDLVSEDARIDLGRVALLAHRPDLALLLLDENDDRPTARLFRANAEAQSSDKATRNRALETFAELLDSEIDQVRSGAAFALTTEAASDPDIPWDERAAEIARTVNAAAASVFRAEHLRLHGDTEAAENELLPHVGHRQALRVLRDIAAERGDWPKAQDRSNMVLRTGAPSYYDRYGDARICLESGNEPQARERFLTLARTLDAPEVLRSGSFSAAADIAGRHRDYAAVKEVAEEWHSALPDDANGSWNLVFSLARLAEHTQAYELLTRLDLEARTENQALLAAEILYRAAPPDAAVRDLEALSSRFGRTEGLEIALISAALDAGQAGVVLPEALAVEVSERLESFSERFPESGFIQRLDAPASRDDLDALMRETHEESARAQLDAHEAIANGQLPVNALAVVSPVGQVGVAWSRLASLPLGFGQPALDTHERAAANDAIGGGAVWDPSSIYISNLLGNDVANRIGQALPGSLIATQTLEDADAAASGGGPAASEIGYDPATQRAFMRTAPEQEIEHQRSSIDSALNVAKALDVRAPVQSGDEDQLSNVIDNPDFATPWQVFAATVLTARQLQRPVYSDDRWIRVFARALGVRAFGTVALVDAMRDRGLLSAKERGASRLRLAEKGAWGLGLTDQEIIEEARNTDWDRNRAVAGALRDQSPWRTEPTKRLGEMVEILAAVHADAPSRLGEWLRHVLDAACSAAPRLTPARWTEWLLAIAWDVDQPSPVLTDAAFQDLVDEVKRLPPGYATIGFDPILGAIAEFLAISLDQPNQIRARLFFLLIRRLRLNDQMRAFDQFVDQQTRRDTTT
jgi:hypothetical protein